MRCTSCLEKTHKPRQEEKKSMQESTKAKYKPDVMQRVKGAFRSDGTTSCQIAGSG